MFINFIFSGILLGVGALFPETYLCFIFFLFAAVFFRLGLESKKPYLGSFLAGVLFHAIAFYWLQSTVQVFGGLNPILGFLVMLLFCVTAAPQFMLSAYLFRYLKDSKYINSVALPSAWLVSSCLWPKMFPWEIAHGLIVIKSIAGLAEYVGVALLSFLFFWWAEVLVIFFNNRNVKYLTKCFIFTLLLVFLGYHRNYLTNKEIEISPEVDVALIQGNLSLEVKGKQAFFNANLDRYVKLSKNLIADLIIWPESVVSKWLHVDFENIEQGDLNFNLTQPLLFGALAYQQREVNQIEDFVKAHPELATRQFLNSFAYEKFNAAIGIDSKGKILGQYYKRVLMPFGEYFPFSNYYPQLKAIFPMVGDFTPGEINKPIVFEKNIKTGLLICYEDLIPALSQEMVNNGANILVNLTNDAWYGQTPASQQHHLLALWRAIETRRYFLRATNTGFTAIVSPIGRTEKSLEIFSEQVLQGKIKLLSSKTLYSFWGEWPRYLLSFVIFAFFLKNYFRRA